jgi:hypothetical protein
MRHSVLRCVCGAATWVRLLELRNDGDVSELDRYQCVMCGNVATWQHEQSGCVWHVTEKGKAGL